MKLQTLTLPTGQFMIIVSEAPLAWVGALDTKKLRDELRESTGAVDTIFTDQPVEVQDAYELNAHRGDEGKRWLTGLLEPATQIATFSVHDEPAEPELVDLSAYDALADGDRVFRVGDRVWMSGISEYGTNVDGLVGRIINLKSPHADGVHLRVPALSDMTVTVRPQQLEPLAGGTVDPDDNECVERGEG
jgi:hypothetical protein